MSKKQSKQTLYHSSRHWICVVVFACLFASLFYKIVSFDAEQLSFLRDQSDKRSLRYQDVAFRRGDILDRNGRPLAVSTRIFSIYVDPHYYSNTVGNAAIISAFIGISSEDIIARIQKRDQSRYVVLARNLHPGIAESIERADVLGLYLEEGFKRFYPASETTGQLLGYTNDEGTGIEGIELAFNSWLRTKKNQRKKVIVDGHGQVIKDFGVLNQGSAGKDLVLSIDLRIQELAYIAIQKQVRKANANHGFVVVVDPQNGEILALAGYPSFNPNNRSEIDYATVRNRVFADAVEPGSIIKPITVAAALNSGAFDQNSMIDTGKKRFFDVGKHRISDSRSYGKVTLEQLISKSSNIAAAKVGLTIGSGVMLDTFTRLAFDSNTGSHFPGEVDGRFSYGNISQAGLAALSYGYGLEITLAQIARAYSVIANGGKLVPISLIRQEQPSISEFIFEPEVTTQVRDMMRHVTRDGGTAVRAAISGYEVAGKTGTVHKVVDGAYSRNKYRSLFVGMAPAENPELVAVIMVDEPGENYYYGGEVAAPVFSEVVSKSLKLLNISPDV